MPESHEHLTTLYWTARPAVHTVHSMIKNIALLFAASLSLLLISPAHAGNATAVSADDAQTAVVQGAYVVDVRTAAAFSQGHLPQAAWLPADAAQLPLKNLAALLATAGIDSSRTMLIVGDVGDSNAQALWQRLASVTSGRVLWLVGGVQEWQMRGHALTEQITSRYPVPQFLVSFDTPVNSSRMAGSRVRTSSLLERNLPVQLALN